MCSRHADSHAAQATIAGAYATAASAFAGGLSSAVSLVADVPRIARVTAHSRKAAWCLSGMRSHQAAAVCCHVLKDCIQSSEVFPASTRRVPLPLWWRVFNINQPLQCPPFSGSAWTITLRAHCQNLYSVASAAAELAPWGPHGHLRGLLAVCVCAPPVPPKSAGSAALAAGAATTLCTMYESFVSSSNVIVSGIALEYLYLCACLATSVRSLFIAKVM